MPTPLQQAARIPLHTVTTYLRLHGRPDLVRFVLFDDRTYEAYADALAAILSENRCR